MKKTIFEAIIVLIAVYLLQSFIMWSVSFTDWGIIGRLVYVSISIGIIFINVKYAHV